MRLRISWSTTASFLAAGCFVLLLLAGSRARAHDEVDEAPSELAGAVAASFLASPDAELGAALGADIFYALEWFRVGAYFGVAMLPAELDERNRVFMPFGASVGIEFLGDRVGFALRVRGGFWGGATQDAKLTAGGFIGGGLYFLIALGARTSVQIGFDVIGLFGDGQTALFAPNLGLAW